MHPSHWIYSLTNWVLVTSGFHADPGYKGRL